MARENILIVSYDFPPALSGVRRVVKFAKYLPEFGYHPIVLAATAVPTQPMDRLAEQEVIACGYPVYRTAACDLNHVWAAMASVGPAMRALKQRLMAKLDLSASEHLAHLSKERSEQVEIGPQVFAEAPLSARSETSSRLRPWLRLFAKQARRWLYFPDDRVGWLPFAIPTANHILDTRPVRYVLTTSYPNSTHLVGLSLKRKYRLFWIADFRDGWTTNPYFANYPTRVHRLLNKRWERAVAREADLLLAVSEPIAEHLRELSCDPGKVHVIANGFDPDDYPPVLAPANDKFTLVYTGTLFGQRSPEPLFAAMRILFDKYPKLEDEFQVVLLAQLQPEHYAMLERYGLAGKALKGGKLVSHREAIEAQWRADALLAIEGAALHGEMMLTQKVFEYMAAGKPVLAITPENALARIVRHTGIGCVVSPDDIELLVTRLYELFMGTFPYRPQSEIITKYHRRNQAAQLAHLLERLRANEISALRGKGDNRVQEGPHEYWT
ncbi:MAG: glycosyltransferase, partial [Candidatus Sumerlaeaceae bacterium]